MPLKNLQHRCAYFVTTFLMICSAPRVTPATEPAVHPDRLWPLPVEINLTSSFGEFRQGHLHAGLDIKTYGVEGVPCRAVGSGHISRMRASPRGYGKAVYLKLDSGETAVYAHLSEFAPQLERALREEQEWVGKYRVDIHFKPERFRIEHGEIIGYTGATGATAQHLHFEVRDSLENPVNPLSRGWSLQDNQSPVFRKFLVLPLTPDSKINGACAAKEVAVRRVDHLTFTAVDTLVIHGRVGFGAYIVDRLNSASGRLAPYRVELAIDGMTVSTIELERFTYSHTKEVELAYEMGRARTNRDYFLMLFKRQGETLWNRWFADDGIVDTESIGRNSQGQLHAAVVHATDRAGNVSRLYVPFYIKTEAVTVAAKKRKLFEDCFFFEDMMSVDPGIVSRESADALAGIMIPTPEKASGRDGGIGLIVGSVDQRPIRVELIEQGDPVFVIPVKRGADIVETVEELGVGISAGARTFYGDVFMYLAPAATAAKKRKGLSPVTRAVRIGPNSLVFRSSISLRFPVGDSVDDTHGIYKYDERKKKWGLVGSTVEGDSVVAGIRSPGVYGVFVDSTPPKIKGPRLQSRKSYATGERTHEIVVTIMDEESGVDDEHTDVFVGGRRQIARWDPFSQKMFVPIGHQNIIGKQEVLVVAKDRAGNTSRIDVSMEMPAPASDQGKKRKRHAE